MAPTSVMRLSGKGRSPALKLLPLLNFYQQDTSPIDDSISSLPILFAFL
jgi:hypothetical protein